MFTALSSNAITAKARAIYGKRLTERNYRELLRLKSVSDVAAYLQSVEGYSSYFSDVNPLTVHRGQLELMLRRSLFDKFFRICHYDFSHKKGFYGYVIKSAEIEAIINAIVLLNSGAEQEIITTIPAFMQDYVSFDFVELAKIRSFSDLLKVLENTGYHTVLKRFDAEIGEIDVSGCEFTLETKYYQNILSQIDKNYKGKTALKLREVILSEIELTNVSIIYRLRYLYKLSPDEVKKRVIPFYHRLSKRQLEALIDNGGELGEDFLQKAKVAVWEDDEPFYIENHTQREANKMLGKLMRFSSSAPIVFYTLMSLSQFEIQNITIIIEGIRYGIPSEEIARLLILPYKL